MDTLNFPARPFVAARDFGRATAFGLPIWAAFLLALEPDNIARAINAGGSIDWREEAVRIVGASLLGALSTPLLLAVVKSYPVERGRLWRNLMVHATCYAAIALGLILVSCFLAVALGVGDTRPVLVALPHQINANWLLLIFCLVTLSALAHATGVSARKRETAPVAVNASFITSVVVKARGRTTLVELSTIDWIESQGNYLALHAGDIVQLLREPLQGFEAKLDPQRFVRVHRRIIVALDRIADVSALAGGNICLRLKDGKTLRVSRNFRDKLRTALSLPR